MAERINRTLVEKVRCMLSTARVGRQFWAEALEYACHLINKLPSATLEGKTPVELWSGSHANDYDLLRVFGCPSYYHFRGDKLEPRAKKAIFPGFHHNVKGFKLWDMVDQKIVISRDITLDETSLLKSTDSQQVKSHELTTESSKWVEIDVPPHSPASSTSYESTLDEVT